MRFKVVVAYDGSSFHGWQTQHKNNSVQEAIEKVLSDIHQSTIAIVASGRTDSKVHALKQVFHFDSDLDISESQLVLALNSQLPKTIRIRSAEIVHNDFHARFDATGKRYGYYLSNDTKNPFIHNYMDIDFYPLDLELMQEAATIFLGTHDFTSFTSAKINPNKSKIKTITNFEISKEDDVTKFIIEGDGFLRYMVRMIVQTVILVGKKKLSVEYVKEMLDAKDKHLCSYKANPSGLYLEDVFYK